jgi:N-dimethylarginine dimethylaminohydrolase
VIKTESAVLVEKRNSAAIELLEKTGIKVISLDLSEFIKGRGGPSCLVLPISDY